MWAAYKGRVEVARLLLEKGANPNITGQVRRAFSYSMYKHLLYIRNSVWGVGGNVALYEISSQGLSVFCGVIDLCLSQ